MLAAEPPAELTGKTAARKRARRWVRLAVGCLAATVGIMGLLRIPQEFEPILVPFELRILDWHALIR
ncbi:MAG: hypothetical protein HYV62_12775, partial [Candidatus Rokubacteria bacterium]|nr:hypothetical protein [Candidatus Rokubacteria bacterium]